MNTDMQHGAALLHAHIMASAQDLAIFGDQTSANRNAAFGVALLCLLHGSDESGFLVHDESESVVQSGELSGRCLQYNE
jgi:hypothetical protein